MKVGNKMRFVKVMSGIAAAAVITGCSSGSSSTAAGDTQLSGTVVTAMDPYAMSCIVKSGLLRATEVDSANSPGRYLFENVTAVAGPVTATGCIDKASGVALPDMASPAAGMVTPITTVMTDMMDADPALTVDTATQLVRTNMGIPANVNPITFDPITAAATSPLEAVTVQAIASKLTSTIKMLEGAGSADPFAAITTTVIAGSFDLDTPVGVTALASAAGVDPVIVTNAIVAVNTNIATVAATFVPGTSDFTANLKQMTAATSVAEALAAVIATGDTVAVDTAVTTVGADITTAIASVDNTGLTSDELVLDGGATGATGGTSF